MPKYTQHFRNNEETRRDYLEGNERRGSIFFGHSKDLDAFKRDIDQNGTASRYYCRVLYPEWRGEAWTYEKNKAFWLGAINAGREFILISDINDFKTKGRCTIDEVLWLKDNEYEFRPDYGSINEEHTRIFFPLEISRRNPFIVHYNYGRGNDGIFTEGGNKGRMTRMNEIVEHVNKLKSSEWPIPRW